MSRSGERADAAPAPFDVGGPLPTGLTVLEASAGTGKTWSIASLVARYVLEGVPIRHLLVVTFTRAATGELRDRVRERLGDTERLVAELLDGRGPLGTPDPVVAPLVGAERSVLERARARLATATADFDAATVTTTHGFCETVLAGLGLAGDTDSLLEIETDTSVLIDAVADDLLVAAVLDGDPLVDAPADAEAEDLFDAATARAVARTVAGHPEAGIMPVATEQGPGADRARFARAVRAEIEHRKLRASVVDFDDLLVRLDRSLASDEALDACRRLRTRYPVVLVDEFQDTDPLQWRILRRLFTAGDATLVLIGDPKQAIYNFRGADVGAYLEARHQADRVATLAVNWRSDAALLRALDALLGGASLGDPAIRYRPVEAAPRGARARLEGSTRPEALRIRVARADDGFLPLYRGRPTKDGARAVIARDLAVQTVALLDGGATLVDGHGDRPQGGQPLHPGHLAVLVDRNSDAELVQGELMRAGVPAVINGAGSVLATAAATEWRQLLEAIERPSEPRVRAVARSSFVGWTDARLADAGDGDGEIAALTTVVRQWASVLEESGVAALLEAATVSTGLPARLLARPGGERRITDLHHVGQLLHAEAATGTTGANALTTWLRARIRRAGEGFEGADERTRRLETDADAVQVLTVHRSKGLEFPVVMLPFLWASGYRRDPAFPVCRDPDEPTRRIVDVGGRSTARNRHKLAADREASGEELRAAYVALTRARHQVLLWWAGGADSGRSALARLVCRASQGEVAAPSGQAPTDATVLAHLERLVAEAPGDISVERVSVVPPERWAPAVRALEHLDTAPFQRPLDLDWRRVSYSSLLAGGHDPRGVGSEAEGPEDDEQPATSPTTAAAGSVGDRVPLDATPGGRAFGTLVHAVLEHLDFASDDLEAATRRAVEETVRRVAPVPGLDPAELTHGVLAALRSPLGPDIGVASLSGLTRADRMDELDFELPLAGGDRATGRVGVADVARLLASALPADDPLAAWPSRLSADVGADLRGFLTGSIDLVARAPGPDGTPRFHVVDYKTNRLAPRDQPLLVEHYRPSALVAAMIEAHYPLQALLYAVALHRFLRWRLADYDPDLHLGAIHYLFLRGMAGPSVPTEGGRPAGVFAWTPPSGLVPALSDLLDAAGTSQARS